MKSSLKENKYWRKVKVTPELKKFFGQYQPGKIKEIYLPTNEYFKVMENLIKHLNPSSEGDDTT